MSQPVVLAPDEVAADHTCTDTSLYAADRGLLAYMLQDVRAMVRLAFTRARDVDEYEPIIWYVHGLKRRIVHCAECTQPHGHRPTRQTHIPDSTGASGPDGHIGRVSVIS